MVLQLAAGVFRSMKKTAECTNIEGGKRLLRDLVAGLAVFAFLSEKLGTMGREKLMRLRRIRME